jgi:hypothetical protein
VARPHLPTACAFASTARLHWAAVPNKHLAELQARPKKNLHSLYTFNEHNRDLTFNLKILPPALTAVSLIWIAFLLLTNITASQHHGTTAWRQFFLSVPVLKTLHVRSSSTNPPNTASHSPLFCCKHIVMASLRIAQSVKPISKGTARWAPAVSTGIRLRLATLTSII